MPCIAPPPPAIEATVSVTSPSLKAQFTPNAASRPYMDAQGNLDFSCFSGPITVILHISPSNPDVVFDNGYKGSRTPVTFLDDGNSAAPKVVAKAGDHQFRKGIAGGGTRTISFEYHNDWDGGTGDGVKRYARSKYGVRLANTGGFLGEIDPIIDNGGGHNSIN
jgi:hypothetical protein